MLESVAPDLSNEFIDCCCVKEMWEIFTDFIYGGGGIKDCRPYYKDNGNLEENKVLHEYSNELKNIWKEIALYLSLPTDQATLECILWDQNYCFLKAYVQRNMHSPTQALGIGIVPLPW